MISAEHRRLLWFIPLIPALALYAFQDAFQTPFFTDDFVWVNHYIGRGAGSVALDYFYFLTHDLLGTQGFGHFYRPLPRAVFTTGWLLFQYQMWGYHALTFLIHLGVVAAVGWMTWRLTRMLAAALAAALFFAVHPSHGISITWVCALSDPLYTFFFALGAGWLAHMIDASPEAPFASRRRNLILFGIYILALGSKESAMTFPILAAAQVAIFQSPPWRWRRERGHWKFFGTLTAITVVYFFWRAWVCGGVAGYGTHTSFPLDRMQANAWELLRGSTFYFTDLDRISKPLGWLQLTIAFCALMLLKLLASTDNRYRRVALFGVVWLALANVISLNVGYKPWYNYVTSAGAALAVGATVAAPLPAAWTRLTRLSLHAGAAAFVAILTFAHVTDLRQWNAKWAEMTAAEFDRIAVFPRTIKTIPDGLVLYCDPPMAHANWWMKSYIDFVYQRNMQFSPVVHGVNHAAIRPRDLRRTVFLQYDARQEKLLQVMHHNDIVRRLHAPYDPRYNHFLSWNFDDSDYLREALVLGPEHLQFPPRERWGTDAGRDAIARQLRYILYPDNKKVFIFKEGGYYPEEAELDRRADAEIRDGHLVMRDVRDPRVVMLNLHYFFDTIDNPCEVTLRWKSRDPEARVTFFWAAHALIFPLDKVRFRWTPLVGGNGTTGEGGDEAAENAGYEMKTFRVDCNWDPTDKTDLYIWSGRAHRVGLLLEGQFDEVEVDSIRFLN